MRITAYLALTLVFLVILSSTVTYGVEIDAVCVVTRVIDGDTIDVRINSLSSKFSGKLVVGEKYRIRFADINAPEIDTVEGKISYRALAGLIKPGDTVYLDIDDKYIFDKYGRIVAVVYIKHNETHLLNVNKWLLEKGYATIWDHDNEFNPWQWSLYVEVSSYNNTLTSSKHTISNSNTENTEAHLTVYGLYYLIGIIGVGLATLIAMIIYYFRIRKY